MFSSVLAAGTSSPPFRDLSGHVKVTQHDLSYGVHARLCLGTLRRKSGKPETVAIKVLLGASESPGPRFAAATREMLEEHSKAWCRVDHPNLVPFFGLASDLAYMPSLIFPYYRNGNIMHYLERRYPDGVNNDDTIQLNVMLTLVKDVARGLEYLHNFEPVIIHGDIRGANIFIDDTGHARLADYGLILAMPGNAMSHVLAVKEDGIFRWMSPELLRAKAPTTKYGPPQGYSKASDVYALAMTILEIYTRKAPFGQMVTDGEGTHSMASSNYWATQFMYRGELPPLSGFLIENEIMKNLILRCWAVAPEERPSAAEICTVLDTIPTTEEGILEEPPQDLVQRTSGEPSQDAGNTIPTPIGSFFSMFISRFIVGPWRRISMFFLSFFRRFRRPF